MDIEELQGQDQYLLQIPEVPMKVLPMGSQGEDRVAYELAGAVIGHVTAPPHFVHFDAPPGSLFLGKKDVRIMGGTPKGNRGGVFKKKELVRHFAPAAKADQLLLVGEGLTVRNPPQPPDLQDGEGQFRHPLGKSPSSP
jgi:hypothetical protein